MKIKLKKKMQPHEPLDIYPAAISSVEYPELEIYFAENAPIYGCVVGKNGAKVYLPPGRTAQERVTRTHEALHLQAKHHKLRQPKGVSKMAFETAKDMIVEGPLWYYASYNLPVMVRDLLCTHYKEARKVLRTNFTREQSWLAIIVAARLVASYKNLGPGERALRLLDKLCQKIARAINVPEKFVENVLHTAHHYACKGKVESAARTLQKLFNFTIDEPEPKKCHRYDRPAKAGTAERNYDEMDVMEIVQLPLTRPSTTSRQTRKYRAAYGSRIIHSRLPSAIAAQSTARLFKRKLRVQGGVILIDASGSMGLEDKELAALCDRAPMATVAYYYGKSAYRGRLCIYATGGRKASDTPREGSGNTVDYWAVKWLLSQREQPKILISDGGFCDGPEGQEHAAMALLADAVKRGEIIWLETIEKGIEFLDSLRG